MSSHFLNSCLQCPQKQCFPDTIVNLYLIQPSTVRTLSPWNCKKKNESLGLMCCGRQATPTTEQPWELDLSLLSDSLSLCNHCPHIQLLLRWMFLKELFLHLMVRLFFIFQTLQLLTGSGHKRLVQPQIPGLEGGAAVFPLVLND